MIKKKKHINIVIDRLTNSIENAFTGEVFNTEITLMTEIGIKHIIRKDWIFDWVTEIKDKQKKVYKLTTVNNSNIIHGLISIEDKKDHIFMHLVESAKFNMGKNKQYVGVPGNLVAFACKISFEKNYEGYVAFDSKSKLIGHYQDSLGATHFRGIRMYIDTSAAKKLVDKYFKK